MSRPDNIARRVSDLIGRTPLLELCRTGSGSRLLLKLEQFNPTGSAKIRMARQMVIDAELDGHLPPGGHIIESTSGNTGLGLAVVAAERGYRFTAVVDNHAAKDKLRAMAAMGARLVYVADTSDDGPSATAREEHAALMAATEEGAYFFDQHNNPSNALGYRALADELRADLGTGIDYLVSSVGTGGSLFGTARELRRRGIPIGVIGVEPVGSIVFGGPGGPYWQSGTGTPPGAPIGATIDYDLLDEGIKVSDVHAFATSRAIARRNGLMLGGSVGGAVYVAMQRLREVPAGSTIVTIVCDGGEKYLDTIFNDDWMRAKNLLDPGAEGEVEQLLDGYAREVETPTVLRPTAGSTTA
ncbi:PLP-dependent cysteine synthase family protein [Nocardia fluminea]|uniref:PLP-dependent cysteine synthase family protein n=1 Tax=Nocardia fluminea TaxID=134984 RepID=UPI001FE8A6DA|nr:cysteine synthase family protein [Nocardia fluminea]